MSSNNPPFREESRADAVTNPHWHIGENVRGAIIMIVGSVALVGVAWGAMLAVTSPDGWVTKAANTALSGEEVTLTSFADSSAD